MATVFIQKRKCRSYNSYSVRYKDPVSRKVIHYKVFRRQLDAKYAAQELRMMIDHGKLYQIPTRKYRLNLLSFKNSAKLTRQEWEIRLKKGNLKQVSYDGYCLRLKLLIREFGKQMLWEIQTKDIEKYLDHLILNQSVITANRTLFVLKQVFRIGLKKKAIIDDPVKKITYQSEKGHARTRFLLPNQINELLKVSHELPYSRYMPSLLLLGAEHGTSKQEALSLKWTDVEFDYMGQGLIIFSALRMVLGERSR